MFTNKSVQYFNNIVVCNIKVEIKLFSLGTILVIDDDRNDLAFSKMIHDKSNRDSNLTKSLD